MLLSLPHRRRLGRQSARRGATVKIRKSLWAAGVLTMVMGALPAPAGADRLRCGQRVTEDVVLRDDLRNCPDYGLKIGADGVDIDLNGHTIDGDGIPFRLGAPDAGVRNAGFDDVTVANGTIRQFEAGLHLVGATDTRLADLEVLAPTSEPTPGAGFLPTVFVERSRRTRIANSLILGGGCCGDAIQAVFSDGTRIVENLLVGSVGLIGGRLHVLRDNDVRGLGLNGVERARIVGNALTDSGISMFSSNRNVVARNTVATTGPAITLDGDGNRVRANHIVNPPIIPISDSQGIILGGGSDNRIAANRIARTSSGIMLVGLFRPTNDNVLRANTVRDVEQDAFEIAGLEQTSGTVLTRNVAITAGDDGFDIKNPSTALRRNLAVGNHDLGFEAVPGVTDRGRNRAFGNGNPLQCLNIACVEL
jgi:large repetitive protein